MDKIQELKEKYNKKTSEDLFDIPEPPDYQCKNIDKIIEAIRNAEKCTSYRINDDEDDLKNKLDEINCALWNLESQLEDIRTAIESLRSWGNEWKNLCKKIVNDYDINLEELYEF